MTYLQSSKARLAIAAAVAAATSTLLVFLINLIVPGALGPVSAALLAALAGVLVFSLAAKGNEAEDSRQFIRVVGHSIDDIMIGAAETSYFVDSVKKKIEKDVQTAGEMVVSAEQVARTTERIAANAERAATPGRRPPTWPPCRKNRRASPVSSRSSPRSPRAPICWR